MSDRVVRDMNQMAKVIAKPYAKILVDFTEHASNQMCADAILDGLVTSVIKQDVQVLIDYVMVNLSMCFRD